MIVSVDPGIRGAGVAVFGDDARLFRAAYVKNPVTAGSDVTACVAMALAVTQWVYDLRVIPWDAKHTLVLEWPQVLAASHQKGSKRNVDSNDLLALVGVDCAIAMAYRESMDLISVNPYTWKKQLPKEVMCRRVWERLSEEERKNVERTPRDGGLKFDGYEGGVRHDVLDGAGVGLWHLGRLARRRVFA